MAPVLPRGRRAETPAATGLPLQLPGYAAGMHGHDDPEFVRTPQTDPPTPRTERRRRRQAGLWSLVGVVVGGVVGVIAGELIEPGSGYVVVGLGVGLAVVGFFAGGLVAESRTATDVDSPVRDRRAARSGRAATDPRGQTVESPVEPDHAPAHDTTSHLPSQRDLNDPDAGRAVPGTEWRPTKADP